MNKNERYEVLFAQDLAKFTRNSNGIETEVRIIAASTVGTEIRSIKLKNNRELPACLDVCSSFKPVLSSMGDDISHPAFNNLFLKYSVSPSGSLIVKRNKRGKGKDVFLGCNLFLESGEDART